MEQNGNSEWAFLTGTVASFLHNDQIPNCIEPLDKLVGPELKALAERHRLIPVLAKKFSETDWKIGHSLKTFRDIRSRNCGLAARTSSLINELASIRELFTSSGIRWFTYKGPVLSMDLYGDPLTRPCDDLDLLVHPNDMPRALGRLKTAGYRAQHQLNPGAMKERLRGNWGFDFRSPENDHLIELKTDIAPAFYALQFGGLIPWDRPRWVDLDGISYPILPADLQTIALAAHGGWHLWERLLWILDFSLCLKQDEEQLSAMIDLAHRIGATRLLQCGYYLARRSLGAQTIPAIDQTLSKEHTLVAKLCEPILNGLIPIRTQAHPLKELIHFHLRTRERTLDRTIYLYRLLTYSSEGDWACLRFPESLSGGYRLIRPFRLAGKVVRGTHNNMSKSI